MQRALICFIILLINLFSDYLTQAQQQSGFPYLKEYFGDQFQAFLNLQVGGLLTDLFTGTAVPDN